MLLLPAEDGRKDTKSEKHEPYTEKEEKRESASSTKTEVKIQKAKKRGSVHRERGQDGEGYYQREDGRKDTKSEKTRNVHRKRRHEGKCYLQCALAFGAFHRQTALTLHLWRWSKQISAMKKK